MDHLCAGISLLTVVGQCYRIELANGLVTAQHHAGVFPSNRRSSLNLGPGDLCPRPCTQAALGDEVVNAALTVLITGIPVLHRAVFDFRVAQGHQLYHGCMQLVLVAHRGRTPFEVAHMRSLVRNNQGALKLSCIALVDPKVGRKFHRTAHALGNVDERTVTKDRGVQCCVVVVLLRDHRAKVLFHQFRMAMHGLGDWAKDHAGLC